MPRIADFYGISITMLYEAAEPARIVAMYAGERMQVGVNPLTVLRGALPPRALGMVIEWAALHQEDLEANWRRAQDHVELEIIGALP